MRLEFNIVIIDDDFSKTQKSDAINDFVEKLEQKISDKGFYPNTQTCSSVDEFMKKLKLNKKNNVYIDLCLSDNNLGSNSRDSDANTGISVYLDTIKPQVKCDFILYSRCETDQIISRLIKDLQERQNPNLFSRFTFIARGNDNAAPRAWHDKVWEVLDFILSKREEINTLRAIFAEKTAKFNSDLETILGKEKCETFSGNIKLAKDKGFIDANMCNDLHKIRRIRNGIIHEPEDFDNENKTWFIAWEDKSNHNKYRYDENQFKDLRAQLKVVNDKFNTIFEPLIQRN